MTILPQSNYEHKADRTELSTVERGRGLLSLNFQRKVISAPFPLTGINSYRIVMLDRPRIQQNA